MGKYIEIIGGKYGKLTPLNINEEYTQQKILEGKKVTSKYYNCLCDCGNTHIARKADLLSGNTTSCGCIIETENLIGQKFGRLTVIKKGDKQGQEQMWWCLCDCQLNLPEEERQLKQVTRKNLKCGNTKSCGCYNKEQSKLKNTKLNKYDLSGEYGIGWTTNTNQEFYFDLEDYDLIKDYSWHETSHGYIARSPDKKLLHKLITNTNKDIVVDHKTHNLKDNRKSKLRISTYKNNNKNKNIATNNTSGVTGVRQDKKTGNWRADIGINYEHIDLGTFQTKKEAIKARKAAEEKYFGEWSYDNSMKEGAT